MFTPEELAAMRAADEEIEATFRLTKEEREASRRRDLSAMDDKSRKASERAAIYRKTHREKIAQRQWKYRESHREEERQRYREYYQSHREEIVQRQREYRQRKKAERRQKDEKEAS